MHYDRLFQPQTETCRHITNSNETEGRRIRKVLTNYFDP